MSGRNSPPPLVGLTITIFSEILVQFRAVDFNFELIQIQSPDSYSSDQRLMLTVSESMNESVSPSVSYNHDSLRLIRRMISLKRLNKTCAQSYTEANQENS